ncbi:unnamed protein product [Thlaspi arvense]|uniref:Uncharacterized protein n=1 Tax=Thlaspi arvense TaxID=13288 RepID=A0AAU9S7W1_THLAR|nr:unnamed protein product [Thlaspi arvense]
MEITDGKRRITTYIPENYISILQLRERWINEKERKRKEEEEKEKEEEERRRKQLAEEQQRIEEDLKKSEIKGKREDIDEKRLSLSNRKHWGENRKDKESSIDGGESICAENGATEAIGSERVEDAAPRDEGLPMKNRGRRKRYKKKENKDVAAVKEDVVDECGSIAPPEYVVAENNTPAKDATWVYRKKPEEATGNKTVTDMETHSEDLFIKRGETKNLKAQTRSSHRNRLNQRHDLHPQRVAVEEVVGECGTEKYASVKDGIRVHRKKGEKAMGKISVESRKNAVIMDDATAIETQFEHLSIKSGETETKNRKAQTKSSNRNRPNQRDATMVWVKKEQNERDGDGIGNGV